jgi:tRNA(Arg) A34 adenosine deaminase TadA
MKHIEMMRLAERITQNSDCADRKVGAVVVLAEGGAISASNTAAWDDTNDNHAESKLIVMVELMRKSLEGATLYTTCRPCARCTAILLGRGIKAIYYRDRQPEMGHLQALVKDGVYLNSGWITGQLPAPLEQVQQTWVERWQ